MKHDGPAEGVLLGFLFVFDKNEMYYGKETYDILKENDYSALTFSGLATAIQRTGNGEERI